ncbi:MAG: hypothetical protein LBQ58_01120 [Synergistaceae bacterium]|jgi:hypothetical protein|nr:hypothetical protein [Synergistaceae bacterium]
MTDYFGSGHKKRILRHLIWFIIALLIMPFIIAALFVDFSEPLNHDMVLSAVSDVVGYENIVKISLRKGGMAGSIGFYFIELSGDANMLVADDARFPLDYLANYRRWGKWIDNREEPGHVTFLDFFLSLTLPYPNSRSRYPKIDNTLSLSLVSFKNLILRRKDEEQLFWSQYK